MSRQGRGRRKRRGEAKERAVKTQHMLLHATVPLKRTAATLLLPHVITSYPSYPKSNSNKGWHDLDRNTHSHRQKYISVSLLMKDLPLKCYFVQLLLILQNADWTYVKKKKEERIFQYDAGLAFAFQNE